jgi:hypothetical protein
VLLKKRPHELTVVMAPIIINQQGSEPPLFWNPADAWKQGLFLKTRCTSAGVQLLLK